MTTKNATVISDFQRTIRDEPAYYIYKVKIWVKKQQVDAAEVIAWLRERYVTKPRGHRYRVATYNHKNEQKYVDYIMMETCDDNDLVYIAIRWGWSKTKVARGNRVKRKRLTPDQKAYLDMVIKQTKDAFYKSLE